MSDEELKWKSWKEEFTNDDVNKFLDENDILDWSSDGINNGDVFLVSKAGVYIHVTIEGLVKIKELFNATHVVVEPFEDEKLLITLSWNSYVE